MRRKQIRGAYMYTGCVCVCVCADEHKQLCPMGPGYGPDGMGKH